MEKIAPVDYPVHKLIRQRWSPRAFSDKTISNENLNSLFEAARWAPSSFNEQPWFFSYARKEDSTKFKLILNCLSEKNQLWAKTAPLLMVTIAKTAFDHNGKPNPHAWHDVGQAISSFTLQAMSLGIYCHQMAGFSRSQISDNLQIPNGFEPVSAVAIGYLGDSDNLTEDQQIRERVPRFRKKQTEFVFSGIFPKKS